MCKAFPSIDWTKATWKLKQPAALWAENRYAHAAHPGSPVGVIVDSNGDLNNSVPFFYAYRGTIPNYNGEPSAGAEAIFDVFLTSFVYHMRSGEFVSRYDADCQWHVYSRERLCPAEYALFYVQKPDVAWLVDYDEFADMSVDWQALRAMETQLSDPILGPFTFANSGVGYVDSLSFAQTWRKILKPAECEFIPAVLARGFTLGHFYEIDEGLLVRLDYARQQIASPPSNSWYYRPTAMDLAVEFALTGGFEFGIDGNQSSPTYGAFQIYTGGVINRVTNTEITVNSTDFNVHRLGFIYQIRSLILNRTVYRGIFVPVDETPTEFASRVATEINTFGGYDSYFLNMGISAIAESNTVTITTTVTGETGRALIVETLIDATPETETPGHYSYQQSSAQWSESSPWQLVNRPAVVAEFGVVNRFERTDDNDTLPAWIELELIPL